MQLLAGLNAAQRAAVTSSASVLQVLAPPGSGKTKTLTCRVAYVLSEYGYNPLNVICCTFTIKAAREMRERLRGLVGCELESKVVLGTFHSICRRYLVAYGHLIGIPKGFGIADSSDSKNIVKRIIKRLNLSIDPKDGRAKISLHKAKGKRLEDLPKSLPKRIDSQDFITLFHEYEAALATSQLLDYDDLLLRCVDLLRTYPACVSNIEALLIDEFQDTNIVQFELMKLLASAQRRITIVGDPDQSIYGFRSAEIENLRRMKAFYPEVVVINLEENYRSSSSILALAQEVIEQDTSRPQKKLKSTHCHGTQPVLRRLPNPNEEALWIASEIERTVAMTGGLLLHSDIAILLRSAYLSLLIEKALANSGIPYRMIGGQRFFDRVEIRIIIDYLRTISHPDNNQALLAVINTPSRKIGETSIAELLKLGEEKKLSLWMVVQKVLAGDLKPDKKLSKPAEQELGRLVSLIKTGRQKVDTVHPAATVPSKLIDFVVNSLDFENYLKKKYKDDHEDRIENVKELITHASEILFQSEEEQPLATVEGVEQVVSNGGQEVLAQFLANIVLSSDVENSEEGNDKPRVTISTIHSAKGLEWPVVFIPAIYEGSIPHSRAEDTDEERRLLYVAMTRAQSLLTMTLPLLQSRDQAESILSQFLPVKTYRHLAEVGPIFDDRLIEDMASILHRPMPSQQDLVEGMQKMEGRSQNDDVWPADGSRKPTFMNSGETSAIPEFGRPLAEVLATRQQQQQRSNYSTFARPVAASATSSHDVATTMSSVAAFSTANLSLGFTTAGHQLRTATSEPVRSSTEAVPPQKKPKLSKTTSAQGNIATFFSRPVSAQPRSSSEPTLPARVSKAPPPLQQGRGSVATFPGGGRHDRVKNEGIPEELSSHKLDFRNGMGSVRRPTPLSEASANSKRRYSTLYSSSPPPSPDAKSKEADKTHDDTENCGPAHVADGQDVRPGMVNAGQGRAPLTSYILSKPSSFTTHHTTMSLIGRTGYSSSITSHAGTGRKTLGVRRTMNGWDNRKNK